MESKFILQSKTIQGAVATLLGLVVHLFGLPVGDEELSQVVALLLELVGVVRVVWGRMRTDGKKLTLKAKAQTGSILQHLLVFLALASLLGIGLLLNGCAGMRDLTPPEQASVVGDQLAEAYVGLHEQYLSMHAILSPENVATLEEEVAPRMDLARRALVQYLGAVILWRSAGEKPEDVDALRIQVRRLLSDVGAMLTDYLTTYEGA